MAEAPQEMLLDKGKVKLITLSWNKENPQETARAEKTFNEYIRKGYLAFTTINKNIKMQVFSFNPEWEKIQLMPIMEGG